MRLYQKVEENKPALKFNFTWEYMHPDMILRSGHSHCESTMMMQMMENIVNECRTESSGGLELIESCKLSKSIFPNAGIL